MLVSSWSEFKLGSGSSSITGDKALPVALFTLSRDVEVGKLESDSRFSELSKEKETETGLEIVTGLVVCSRMEVEGKFNLGIEGRESLVESFRLDSTAVLRERDASDRGGRVGAGGVETKPVRIGVDVVKGK